MEKKTSHVWLNNVPQGELHSFRLKLEDFIFKTLCDVCKKLHMKVHVLIWQQHKKLEADNIVKQGLNIAHGCSCDCTTQKWVPNRIHINMS